MSDNLDISATIKVNDQATSKIGAMRNALAGLQGMAMRAGKALNNMGSMAQLGGALKGVGGALRGLGGQVMTLVRPIAALMGIGGGIGMAEAVAGMEKYVTNVKELSRTAPIIGTTVQRLSELQYAGSKVGISAEAMSGALTRANAAIGKAAVGKGTLLTSLFQKLRINLRDANGQLRSSADILPEFAAAIARQTDPILKLRMATEMFGRAAGPEMLKLLEQGEGGIQKFVEEARKLGLVIGPEQEKEALEFAKAQGEVRKIWESLSITLSQSLLPVLKPVIELFAELLRENKEPIVKGLTAAFRDLSEWLLKIDWKETIKDIKQIGSTISEVVGVMGGWRNVIIVLALAVTGLLGPLVTLGGALGKLALTAIPALIKGIALLSAAVVKFGIALLATPIGWIIAGIAALGAAVYLIYKYWEPIKQFFIGLWDGVKAAFVAVDEWLGPWGNLFAPTLIYRNWDAIKSFFSTLWEGVKATFTAVADFMGPWGNLFVPFAIYNNWEGITKFFKKLWDDVITVFDDAWKLIKPIVDALKNAINWITGNIPSISGIGETIKGWGGGLLSKIGIGGGGDKTAAPGVPAQAQSIVQQATAAAPAGRVEGQVGVDIHMSGNVPEGTTMATRQRGQVRATGDVGQSMVPA